MKRRLLAGAAAALVVVGAGTWGVVTWRHAHAPAPTETADDRDAPTALDQQSAVSGVETVDAAENGPDPNEGATPMAQRVAVLGLLNKRNGVARDVQLMPGKAARVGPVILRLRACEHTAPWETDQYTGAFVQVDLEQTDHSWRRAFSGWLYKERPGLNVVQNPLYDVWVKSCAMTFPAGGKGTVSVDVGEGPASSRSNAPKSPPRPATGDQPAEGDTSPSAPPRNAI